MHVHLFSLRGKKLSLRNCDGNVHKGFQWWYHNLGKIFFWMVNHFQKSRNCHKLGALRFLIWNLIPGNRTILSDNFFPALLKFENSEILSSPVSVNWTMLLWILYPPISIINIKSKKWKVTNSNRYLIHQAQVHTSPWSVNAAQNTGSYIKLLLPTLNFRICG